MKKINWRNLKSIAGIIMVIVVILGNANNPPNGKTGAPGDGVCTECHNSGNPNGFDGAINVTGFPATINGGTLYPLTITVTNPNGLAAKAGFQFVILNASNQSFGTMTSAGPNSVITSANGRFYLEHNPAVNFPMNNQVSWTVNWTAPANGTSQTITLYAVANIANGANGNDGDYIIFNTFSGTYVPQPPTPSVNITPTHVTCFGIADGTATAMASGGTPNYSFSWSNGASGPSISNLSPGTYTVTVTDNAGQTATASTTITQPSLLNVQINPSGSTIDCDNPSINLNGIGMGGTPNYSFSWSNGSSTPTIIVTTGGNYSVTVTDNNGCTASNSIFIDEVIPPVLTFDDVGPLCESSDPVNLYAFPTGGYFIGNGVTGFTFNPSVTGPGTFSVSYIYVEDNCEYSISQNITVHADPIINLTPYNVCLNGGMINLTGSPIGGVWSGPGVSGNTFDPSITGEGVFTLIYFFTNTQGCSAEASTTVTVTSCECDQPTFADAGEDQTVCGIMPVTLNGVGEGGIPQWTSTGNGNFTGANTFQPVYTPHPQDQSVVFTLTIPDPDGSGPCTGSMDQVTINFVRNSIILSDINPMCNLDTAIVLNGTPSGGVWTGVGVTNGIFNPNVAGPGIHSLTYSLAISGCSFSKSIQVEVLDCSDCPNPAYVVVEPNLSSCGLDPIVLEGVSNYSASWSTDGSGVIQYDSIQSTFIYIPTASDDTIHFTLTSIDPDEEGPCASAEGTQTVIIHPNPEPFIISYQMEHCMGILCVDSVDNTTITWSTGASTRCIFLDLKSMDENYNVTLTDTNGCSTTQNKLIPLYMDMSISSIEIEDPSDVPGYIKLVIEGGVPPYNFNWYLHNPNTQKDSLISHEQDLSIFSTGFYFVDITDAAGCTIRSDTFELERIGVKRIYKELSIAYPNPFKEQLNIDKKNLSNVKEIQVIDVLGRVVQKIEAIEPTFNLSELNSGLYILLFKMNDGLFYQKIQKV